MRLVARRYFSAIPARPALPAALLAASLLAFCGPRELPPLDPARVFAETEKAINAHYIFPTDDFSAAYAAAGGGGAGTLESLVAAIKETPAERRRAEVYRRLNLFLNALPAGRNSFVKPESLVWARDPERKAGVGLVIRREPDGRFFILDTLEGSASHRDGVKTGVFLNKVDGVPVQGLDQEEVIGRIKGKADTEVKIETGAGTHQLVRGQVVFRNILNADWDTADGGKIEYIALRSTLAQGGGFPGSASQLKDLLIPMRTRKAVIIDVRKMHLGDIEESFRVADLFVRSGTLGSIRAKNKTDKVFTADTDQVYTGPIFLIIGRHSSPLAETLAMAMKMSPNVKLVGAPTDGKAFLAASSEIAGGIEIRLTSGYVLDGIGRPLFETGLPVDFPIQDVLPQKPPLHEPNPGDPAQVVLAQLLNAPVPAAADQ